MIRLWDISTLKTDYVAIAKETQSLQGDTDCHRWRSHSARMRTRGLPPARMMP